MFRVTSHRHPGRGGAGRQRLVHMGPAAPTTVPAAAGFCCCLASTAGIIPAVRHPLGVWSFQGKRPPRRGGGGRGFIEPTCLAPNKSSTKRVPSSVSRRFSHDPPGGFSREMMPFPQTLSWLSRGGLGGVRWKKKNKGVGKVIPTSPNPHGGRAGSAMIRRSF